MKFINKLRKNSDEVFGKTFKRYSKNEITEFIQPFKTRFKKNKINPKKTFKGKTVLDYGCGNGRGALFMAINGAKDLHAMDISKINTHKTEKTLNQFNYKIKTYQSPAEKSPFKNDAFDFVWCNGVIMHTHTPSKVISEIFRVLKPGGQSWIYVYGSDGIWWNIIYKLRKNLKKYKESMIINCLKNLGYQNRFIAEYLDDWKVMNLRTYKAKIFENSMKELGGNKIKKLKRGVKYDTSEKLFNTGNKILFGEGDLRYLVSKSPEKKSARKRSLKFTKKLNSNHHKDHKKFIKYSKIIDLIIGNCKNSAKKKIYVSAKIQFMLRKLLDQNTFNENKFYKFVESLKSDKFLSK